MFAISLTSPRRINGLPQNFDRRFPLVRGWFPDMRPTKPFVGQPKKRFKNNSDYDIYFTDKINKRISSPAFREYDNGV